jgi:hypothetical protein
MLYDGRISKSRYVRKFPMHVILHTCILMNVSCFMMTFSISAISVTYGNISIF